MKSYTKIFFVCAIILFFVSIAIAFDWPQSVAGTSEINKSFGELQGDIFNTSLIFSKAEDVQSTEAGQLMAILGQNSREMGWAPTTLGNAVILAHENNLLTVYGNLQDIDVEGDDALVFALRRASRLLFQIFQHGINFFKGANCRRAGKAVEERFGARAIDRRRIDRLREKDVREKRFQTAARRGDV